MSRRRPDLSVSAPASPTRSAAPAATSRDAREPLPSPHLSGKDLTARHEGLGYSAARSQKSPALSPAAHICETETS